MSLDYASATIAGAVTSGPPGNPAVQPPIAWDKLTAANTEMWNGHIGSAIRVGGPPLKVAALGGTPTDNSSLIAAPGTLGRDKAGALMTWVTSAAAVTAGATGTIAGTVFTAGAGTAVAQGTTTVANAYFWAKN
jgi:hypothetical protein